MRARSLFVIAVCVIGVGCSLTFSPGDYGGEALPSGPLVDGGLVTEGGSNDGAMVDGLIAPPPLHLLVIAGENEIGTATNDVWTAPIDANGDVGAFGYLQPAPLKGPIFAAAIANGKLLVAAKGATSRVVENADFSGGITSGWRAAMVPNPRDGHFGQFFAGTSLISVGGDSQTDGGITIFSKALTVAKLEGNVYPSGIVESPTTLPVALSGVVSATYKNFVFISGSGDQDRSYFFVSPLSETVGASAFAPTTQAIDPRTMKAHAPVGATVCAGEGLLFIVGGIGTNVVLFAAINESTGALGTWRAGPTLPEAELTNAGCAVWNGALHILGGTVKATRSNQILRAKITGTEAETTMAPWELSSGQNLLAPRSNVLALVY